MAPSAAEYGLLMAFVGGFSSLAMLIVEIAFVVVIATTVRRERPDTWGIFLASIGCDLVALLMTSIGTFLMGFLVQSGSPIYALAGINVLGTILRVIARALVIVGVVRLARQPAAAAPWP